MKISKLSVFAFASIFAFSAFLISCGGDSSNETTETEMVEEEMMEDEMMEETMTEEDNESLPSPRRQVSGQIGNATVTVDYGSPAVKGRTIFGDLEPYGEVWRAGANASTNVEFSTDVTINGQTVAAGKYGVFLKPAEEGDWTFILNSVWDGWGAYDYAETNDVLRVNVTPQWSDTVQERLMYAVEDGAIKFAWDKVTLSIPIN